MLGAESEGGVGCVVHLYFSDTLKDKHLFIPADYWKARAIKMMLRHLPLRRDMYDVLGPDIGICMDYHAGGGNVPGTANRYVESLVLLDKGFKL